MQPLEYLSSDHVLVKKHIEELGGRIRFKDCICQTKNSLIPILYTVYYRPKNSKLSDLEYDFDKNEEVSKFIFENAVVLYEMNIHLGDFIADKYFFAEMVKLFIEKTYEKPWFNQVYPEYRDAALQILFDKSYVYFEKNNSQFEKIALKRSRKNKRSKDSRYDELAIIEKGTRKINYNKMKIKDEELLNECYELYKKRELKSFKDVAEYYCLKTGQTISGMSFSKRFHQIAKSRGEDKRILKPLSAKKQVLSYDDNVIPTDILERVYNFRKNGATTNECLSILSGYNISVSAPTLRKYLKAYQEELKNKSTDNFRPELIDSQLDAEKYKEELFKGEKEYLSMRAKDFFANFEL